MSWQFTPYLALLALAAAVPFVLAYFSFRNRDRRTATQVAGLLLGAGIWAGSDAVRLASTDLGTKLLAHNVRFVGSTLLVFATFLFALEYTNRDRWVTKRIVACVGVPFVVTLVLVWTNGAHDLIRTSAVLIEQESMVLAEFEFGTWFFVNAAYSYLLLGTVLLLYVDKLLGESVRAYKRQTAVLTLSMVIPWLLNGLYLAGVTTIDLTAAGFAVTGSCFYASLFWFDLLNLVPIARSTVVDQVEHGVLVLDDEDRVVDVNERGIEMIGLPESTVLGATIPDLFAEFPAIVETFDDARKIRDAITVERGGERRHYEVDVSPLSRENGQYLGRVALIRDVTDRRRRRRELRERTEQLERQNEQLDQFAGVVSHDLRNPLNVAQGHLDLASRNPGTGSGAHLEEISRSLDRMEEIIEDVLELARQSRTVGETERVDLPDLVGSAWNAVDTRDGSLVVATERTVEADPGRLRRSFENLFRNAFDHGSDTATVTVGDLPDGFYVSDDGPGIPDDDRSAAFDQGFSTATEGTGFGLSIVATIVEAHGWSIDVTESDSGGARFEVTGISGETESSDETEPEPAA